MVIVFAATNSEKSINKQLAIFAAEKLENQSYQVLDLNDYEMPIYSVDREAQGGIPDLAHDFFNKISESDSLIISFAEYNGTYTAAFKNLMEWISRIDRYFFQNKSVIALATSPGPAGAKNVLATVESSFSHFGADLIGTFNLPNFYELFSESGISDKDLEGQLIELVKKIDK
jgi:NAD(P)H-dependent FMN reductase